MYFVYPELVVGGYGYVGGHGGYGYEDSPEAGGPGDSGDGYDILYNDYE